ncbi:hypothetical protein MsAg5_07400 [Methanosarcinaceae archaeon Ag5]|uniref:Uncharacterized protein n=2 Tax=Methanolapillus africanus TaxID=3028297 RepID=A0AAE4MHV7_9EURY|nr:hypothetical protein [Methanosarcinaceae archaeon Ag5]
MQKRLLNNMSEEQTLLSKFSTKQFYTFVALGLIILVLFSFFAYTSKTKLKDDTLTPDEISTQSTIYVISKIGQVVGFLVALIPSIGILQKEITKFKDENPTELINFSEDDKKEDGENGSIDEKVNQK